MKWHDNTPRKDVYNCFGYGGGREADAVNAFRKLGLDRQECLSVIEVVSVLEEFYGKKAVLTPSHYRINTIGEYFDWSYLGGDVLTHALSQKNSWYDRTSLSARDMYDLFHKVIYGKWPIEEKEKPEKSDYDDPCYRHNTVRCPVCMRMLEPKVDPKCPKPFVVTKTAHELTPKVRPHLAATNPEKMGGVGKDVPITKAVPIRDNSGLFAALAAVDNARRFDGKPPEHEDHAMLANRKGIK
jgi:hypothetical protein